MHLFVSLYVFSEKHFPIFSSLFHSLPPRVLFCLFSFSFFIIIITIISLSVCASVFLSGWLLDRDFHHVLQFGCPFPSSSCCSCSLPSFHSLFYCAFSGCCPSVCVVVSRDCVSVCAVRETFSSSSPIQFSVFSFLFFSSFAFSRASFFPLLLIMNLIIISLFFLLFFCLLPSASFIYSLLSRGFAASPSSASFLPCLVLFFLVHWLQGWYGLMSK